MTQTTRVTIGGQFRQLPPDSILAHCSPLLVGNLLWKFKQKHASEGLWMFPMGKMQRFNRCVGVLKFACFFKQVRIASLRLIP